MSAHSSTVAKVVSQPSVWTTSRGPPCPYTTGMQPKLAASIGVMPKCSSRSGNSSASTPNPAAWISTADRP